MVAASGGTRMYQRRLLDEFLSSALVHTFKAQVFGNVGSGVLPGNGVLGVAPTWRTHLVEGGDTITGLKFIHALANAVDDASNVVAAIDPHVQPFWGFPGER